MAEGEEEGRRIGGEDTLFLGECMEYFNHELLKSKPVLITTAYAVVLCALYQFGYWSKFGIDILQFYTLQDIIRFAIFPLVASSGYFAIAICSIPVNLDKIDATLQKDKDGALILPYIPTIRFSISVFIPIAACAVLYYLAKPGRWLAMAAILSFPLARTIRSTYLLKKIAISIHNSYFLTYCFILAPILSLAIGKTNAEDILSGYSSAQVQFDGVGSNNAYLGRAGDYIIHLSQDNSTVIFQDISHVRSFSITRTPPLFGRYLPLK